MLSLMQCYSLSAWRAVLASVCVSLIRCYCGVGLCLYAVLHTLIPVRAGAALGREVGAFAETGDRAVADSAPPSQTRFGDLC